MPDGNKGRIYREQLFERDFFGGVQLPWSAAPAFLLSLHEAVPEGADGNLVRECFYFGYKPARLVRTQDAWQRRGNLLWNRHSIQFADPPVGSNTAITHWALAPEGYSYPIYVGEFEFPIIAPIRQSSKSLLAFGPGCIRFRET